MKALIILALFAPPDSSMLAVSGASAMEELDETQVEMYQHLESHPINLNTSSRRQLMSSGLFTPFQTASLLEYRAHAGDILSLAELAAVDGFGQSFVRAVTPYISLRTRAPAGESSTGGGIRAEASARMWAKTDDGAAALSYGGKMKIEAGPRLSRSSRVTRPDSPGRRCSTGAPRCTEGESRPRL